MRTTTTSKHIKSSAKKEFMLFLSIPAAIILIVAAVVLVPRFFAKPKYSFVYQYCPDYYCIQTYTIDSAGGISSKTNVSTLSADSYSNRQAELYIHDIAQNASRKITLAEANRLKLSSSNVSPDGYMLKQDYSSSGGFLFYGHSQNTNDWYLANGLKKKVIHVLQSSEYDSIKFLGWVE